MAGMPMRKVSLIEILFVPFFFLLIFYPLVALIYHLSWDGIKSTFSDYFFWICVKNTILAAIFASLLGTALALGFGYYHMFNRRTIVYKIADLLNDLPIALPHTVAGFSLLLAFGREAFGFAGETGLAFTLLAVAIAMFFVSYPLAARTIASGVDEIEEEVIDVARTLGDTPSMAYIRVVIPSINEAIFSAIVLAFSRSLSEFAAVIMFGGNLPGSTQVLASYVFSMVETGEIEMAVTASAFCIILSLVIVLILRWRKRDVGGLRPL